MGRCTRGLPTQALTVTSGLMAMHLPAGTPCSRLPSSAETTKPLQQPGRALQCRDRWPTSGGGGFEGTVGSLGIQTPPCALPPLRMDPINNNFCKNKTELESLIALGRQFLRKIKLAI